MRGDKEYIYNITHNVDKSFNPFGDYDACKSTPNYSYFLGTINGGRYTFHIGFCASDKC